MDPKIKFFTVKFRGGNTVEVTAKTRTKGR